MRVSQLKSINRLVAGPRLGKKSGDDAWTTSGVDWLHGEVAHDFQGHFHPEKKAQSIALNELRSVGSFDEQVSGFDQPL